MSKISIIAGGVDDNEAIQDSGMFKILEEVGVDYEFSFISSDQNPEELREYCRQVSKTEIEVFICIAGLVPALPGAVKGRLPLYPVIAVPLTNADYQASETMLASFSCPTKYPIIVLGVNRMGLKKAAYCALEMLSLKDKNLRSRLETYLSKKTKKPQIKVKEFKYKKT